jgi:hypothetical protein
LKSISTKKNTRHPSNTSLDEQQPGIKHSVEGTQGNHASYQGKEGASQLQLRRLTGAHKAPF